MRRHSLHVTMPNNLTAMLTVEADRSGDTVAAVIRRCIRRQLAEVCTSKEYAAEYDRLQKEQPEGD